jgi:predicted N-acyltransferase
VRSSDLTRDFFAALSGAVGDAVMLMVAEEAEPGGGGEIIAGALNLVGSQARCQGVAWRLHRMLASADTARAVQALFGRNWGCRVERPFLHMCARQTHHACVTVSFAADTMLGRVHGPLRVRHC